MAAAMICLEFDSTGFHRAFRYIRMPKRGASDGRCHFPFDCTDARFSAGA